MNKSTSQQHITASDLHFASLIFPILTEVVKTQDKLTYLEVKNAVQERYPNDPKVKTMHHRHVGRRLGAIWEFTKNHRNCPHIGAMVVLQSTGECSSGFDLSLDPEEERRKCRVYNWDEVSLDFDRHMKKAHSSYKRKSRLKKKKKPEVARLELSDHWKSASKEFEGLADQLRPLRQKILAEIESGENASTAIAHAIQLLYHSKPAIRGATPGYVYIGEYRLTDEEEPIVQQVKIGTTIRKLSTRAHEIGGGVEGPITFVITHAWRFEPGDAVIAEQLLHGEFAEYRQRGEFFNDLDDVIPELAEEFFQGKFDSAVMVVENEIDL